MRLRTAHMLLTTVIVASFLAGVTTAWPHGRQDRHDQSAASESSRALAPKAGNDKRPLTAHSGERARGPKPVPELKRDRNGRIERSAVARSAFRRNHPCPSTGKGSGACPGYVIDHVVPLKRHGEDSPSNMQWQTRSDARAKDKEE